MEEIVSFKYLPFSASVCVENGILIPVPLLIPESVMVEEYFEPLKKLLKRIRNKLTSLQLSGVNRLVVVGSRALARKVLCCGCRFLSLS